MFTLVLVIPKEGTHCGYFPWHVTLLFGKRKLRQEVSAITETGAQEDLNNVTELRRRVEWSEAFFLLCICH